MTILVIAEHDNRTIRGSTLNVISAATQIASLTSAEIHILIAGSDVEAVADQATHLAGVSKVLIAQSADLDAGLAEDLALTIAHVASDYSHVLGPATSYGKKFLPRLAALLDVAQISDILTVVDAGTFERPVYAGNAVATVRAHDTTKVLSVRTTAFEPVSPKGGCATVVKIPTYTASRKAEFISREITPLERPELGAAPIVVSGGRGLGSRENYESYLGPLADKLKAALGASRAAVDAGFAPNDYQVGQTGKIVAPDLYVAIGISGAIQHLAGMKDSKVIVAINKDAEAPIFSVADYGLVGDLFEVVPQLTRALDL